MKGVLFLGVQLSYKTFSSSSENWEKTPGVETNPPPGPSPQVWLLYRSCKLKRCELELKGNCKYIVTPAIFPNCQVNCSFVKWPMFPILLVLLMLYIIISCYLYFLCYFPSHNLSFCSWCIMFVILYVETTGNGM